MVIHSTLLDADNHNPRGTNPNSQLLLEGTTDSVDWAEANGNVLSVDAFGVIGSGPIKTFAGGFLTTSTAPFGRLNVNDGISNFAASDVGKLITITGANHAPYNGTFTIVDFIDVFNVHVSYSGPRVGGDSNNGSISGNVFNKSVAGTMTLGHTTSQDLSIQAKTRMEHNAVMINDNALGGSNDSAVILRDDGDNNKAIGWRDIQDEVAVWETTDVVGPNDPSGLIDFQKYAEFHCEQLHLEPNITLTENNSLGFNASGELVARDNAGNTVQLTNGGATAGDADAIHDNVAGEIAALTLVTAAAGDHILIEDASDSNNKKRIAASDLLGAGNFGQNYESAVSLANSATTLTGYQVKLTHTTPAHASGTFLVEATWSGSTTVKNKIGFWRFQNTTDAVTYSEEQNLSIANNSYFTMSSRGFVTFSGVAKTFEIQWRSSIGDEVNIRNARFTIWRVS